MSTDFLEPRSILNQLGLSHGMHVADFGSGSGFYTLEAARMVGSDGRVYAIDVQKSMLSHTSEEARREGLHNIEFVWGDIEKEGGSKVLPNSMDVVILANTLFQIENKNVLAQEVKRVLKPGGRLLVVDWTDSFAGLGPHPDHIFPKREAGVLFEESGFEFIESSLAGPHHYSLVFRKR